MIKKTKKHLFNKLKESLLDLCSRTKSLDLSSSKKELELKYYQEAKIPFTAHFTITSRILFIDITVDDDSGRGFYKVFKITQLDDKIESTDDKKVEPVFEIDLNEVVTYLEKALIEPQGELQSILNYSQVSGEPSPVKEVDIKKITSVNVLSKRQMVDLVIVCDNNDQRYLTIPEEAESEFRVGSLIIDYNGRMAPYPKPKSIH